MAFAPAVHGAVLLALVSGLGARLHAAPSEPARSFHALERLAGPRVISWQATSRDAGGHFVLWRIGEDARQVARLEALPGAHAYRFVDREARPGAGVLIYRLAYEARDGTSNLLLVATLAESDLRDGATSRTSFPPEGLAPVQAGIVPLGLPRDLAPSRGARAFFEFVGPEPPPPRG